MDMKKFLESGLNTLSSYQDYLEKLRQEQAQGRHSQARERILATTIKKVEASIANLEAGRAEADRLEEDERLRREALARHYPGECPADGPVLSEGEPTRTGETSEVGREQQFVDARYCLDMLRAIGRDGGRRIGIAVCDIEGVDGNRHKAGDVVLFCDWEPSAVEFESPEGTRGIRPDGWDRLRVDRPLPPEAIKEQVKCGGKVYTHNTVYGVPRSSVAVLAPPTHTGPRSDPQPLPWLVCRDTTHDELDFYMRILWGDHWNERFPDLWNKFFATVEEPPVAVPNQAGTPKGTT